MDLNQGPDINQSPILLISIIIYGALLLCYVCFNILFNKTIIDSIDIKTLFTTYLSGTNGTDDFNTWNNSTLLNILSKLRIGKFVLFILVFIVVTLILLFGVYDLLMGGKSENYSKVYGIISVCFFSTVFTTFILLELVPYLVDIFENTLGYLYICTTRTIDTSIFNNNCLGSEPENGDNEPADNQISYKFLITIMSLFNMNTFIKKMVDNSSQPTAVIDESLHSTELPINALPTPLQKGGDVGDTMPSHKSKFYIQFNNKELSDKIKKIENFANLVLLKHNVGHFVWIYFASLVCTFTSIKAFSQYL